MDILHFLSENMLIVAAALYVVGSFIKAIPAIPDWVIPFVLTALGCACGAAILGIPEGLLQGVLCAGAAVLVHQGVKQGSEALAAFKK